MVYFGELENILSGGDPDKIDRVRVILEDSENPIRRRTLDKLYASIEDRKNIDFGMIPKSKGKIHEYTGYQSMKDTLEALGNLANAEISTTKDFRICLSTVNTAVDNIVGHGKYYQDAFTKNCTPIIIEYNTLVAACVEATTSLLLAFADFSRNPSSGEVVISVKDSRRRNGLFYVDQLQLFNRTVADGSYDKYLKSVILNGRENFFLADDAAILVGSIAVVSAVALSIVPVTRRLVYAFQDVRRRLTDSLELQAYYLELNRTVVESRSDLSAEKREKILKKQEVLRLKFLRLADKIKISSQRNEELSAKTLENSNRLLSIDNIQSEIDGSDIVLF